VNESLLDQLGNKLTGVNIDIVSKDSSVQPKRGAVRAAALDKKKSVALRARSASARDVCDAIEKVLVLSGSYKINCLRFFAHGEPGGILITDGTKKSTKNWIRLTDSGDLANQAEWMKLRGKFTTLGRVELHGCRVAQGEGVNLLKKISAIVGVKVAAGKGDQSSGTTKTVRDQFEGATVVAHPNGTAKISTVNSGPAIKSKR